ncbi:MAG: tRNA ligase subunit PheS family protein, partial [Longimicrobiales bacterium]
MSGNELLIEALQALEKEALEAIERTGSGQALEELRILYLGRKDGRISKILRRLGELVPEDRPAVGAEANRVKEVVQGALEGRKAGFDGATAGGGDVDLSLPGRAGWRGGRHPVTQVVDEIWEIFRAMGFTRARGPEVETPWYNFFALNTPLDHPVVDEAATLPAGAEAKVDGTVRVARPRRPVPRIAPGTNEGLQ